MDFADVADPASHLVPPVKPAEFIDPMDPINAVGDVLGPGTWLMKLAELMLPRNPVEFAQNVFAGDWEAYAECAEAWRNLGRSCEALARNLEAGNGRIDATWHGNAADAAFRYFDTLRRDLEEFRDSLDAMSGEYLAIAQSVSVSAEAVGQCIGAMIDAAVTAVIAAAASTAAGWTGWAAAMGYALGAAEAQIILKQWARMTDLVNAAQVSVNTGYASIERVGGEITARLNAFPLPRTSYDHPAVRAGSDTMGATP
ncbi:WXG100 family type VII secretion target [Streptomyces sp. NPDC053048]|uniref:WXG100 family type VII secretion target n=1 Tax=Streptomyces sp. NPDC053048 TaxID=3365694 RepID=UPI0037CF5340